MALIISNHRVGQRAQDLESESTALLLHHPGDLKASCSSLKTQHPGDIFLAEEASESKYMCFGNANTNYTKKSSVANSSKPPLTRSVTPSIPPKLLCRTQPSGKTGPAALATLVRGCSSPVSKLGVSHQCSTRKRRALACFLHLLSCMGENQHTSTLNHKEIVVKAEWEILHKQTPHGLLQGSMLCCGNTQALKTWKQKLKWPRAI